MCLVIRFIITFVFALAIPVFAAAAPAYRTEVIDGRVMQVMPLPKELIEKPKPKSDGSVRFVTPEEHYKALENIKTPIEKMTTFERWFWIVFFIWAVLFVLRMIVNVVFGVSLYIFADIPHMARRCRWW